MDRLGRSLPDLIASMQDLHGAKVDLFIHQQGSDTTTASGRAMFGMLGVFSQFERLSSLRCDRRTRQASYRHDRPRRPGMPVSETAASGDQFGHPITFVDILCRCAKL